MKGVREESCVLWGGRAIKVGRTRWGRGKASVQPFWSLATCPTCGRLFPIINHVVDFLNPCCVALSTCLFHGTLYIQARKTKDSQLTSQFQLLAFLHNFQTPTRPFIPSIFSWLHRSIDFPSSSWPSMWMQVNESIVTSCPPVKNVWWLAFLFLDFLGDVITPGAIFSPSALIPTPTPSSSRQLRLSGRWFILKRERLQANLWGGTASLGWYSLNGLSPSRDKCPQ